MFMMEFDFMYEITFIGIKYHQCIVCALNFNFSSTGDSVKRTLP